MLEADCNKSSWEKPRPARTLNLALRGEVWSCVQPRLQMPGIQNCEIINPCGFRLLNLWSFVRAARTLIWYIKKKSLSETPSIPNPSAKAKVVDMAPQEEGDRPVLYKGTLKVWPSWRKVSQVSISLKMRVFILVDNNLPLTFWQAHATLHMWISKGSLLESVFSYHVASKNLTQVVRFGGKHLYIVTNLAGSKPWEFF